MQYLCIDLKSFYASVECVYRGLNPLEADLLVADESRTDKTICLAVSPALKAKGVGSRPRLFEAKQAIRLYEAAHKTKVEYIVAPPRMAEYLRVSAKAYEVYRRFLSEEDIHVYSIDECFMDLTPYLHLYRAEAERVGVSPARFLAMRMIRSVLAETRITATAGIGTNLYLAKVGMDIVAKKAKPDRDGVRIAELEEEDYRLLLWEHRPLTDFWQVGPGTARRLITHGMRTMGDVAAMSVANEEELYRLFGVNAEILIDHAWGVEPVRMSDIKTYRSAGHSFSTGQVLPRPYRFEESLLVFREMTDQAVMNLLEKRMRIPTAVWWVSFDPASLEENPGYTGPICLDFYGRLHPEHTGGTVRFRPETNSRAVILAALDKAYREKVNPGLLVRRLGLSLNDPREEGSAVQTDMFTDPEAQNREHRLQEAMIEVRRRFGRNALVRGMNLLEGATAMERNKQIGGHRAGDPQCGESRRTCAQPKQASCPVGSERPENCPVDSFQWRTGGSPGPVAPIEDGDHRA